MGVSRPSLSIESTDSMAIRVSMVILYHSLVPGHSTSSMFTHWKRESLIGEGTCLSCLTYLHKGQSDWLSVCHHHQILSALKSPDQCIYAIGKSWAIANLKEQLSFSHMFNVAHRVDKLLCCMFCISCVYPQHLHVLLIAEAIVHAQIIKIMLDVWCTNFWCFICVTNVSRWPSIYYKLLVTNHLLCLR